MNLCEVVERSLAQKREAKKAERAGDIIASLSCYSPYRSSHFTGPPFVCSPPSSRERPAHIPQKRGGACSRGFKSKERGEERWWWWERREHGTETDPASQMVTRNLSHRHLRRRRPCAWSQCMESHSCIICAAYRRESNSCITHRLSSRALTSILHSFSSTSTPPPPFLYSSSPGTLPLHWTHSAF